MIRISKTKDTIFKKRCEYCSRTIFKTDEPDEKFRLLNGKIICPTCRVLKTTEFKKEIKSDEDKYKEERKEQEKAQVEKAKQNVTDVAMASQDRVGKKYKINK